MILLIATEREASSNRRAFTVGTQNFETSVIISCLISSYLWHSNRKCFTLSIAPQPHNGLWIIFQNKDDDLKCDNWFLVLYNIFVHYAFQHSNKEKQFYSHSDEF